MNSTEQAAGILIVDDDWMIREIMQAHLENAGYRVMAANSGEQALEMADVHPPDLIILDLRLQGLDGYEVCARLKASAATQSAPVIVTTALDTEEARLRALEAGADDFLFKPFDALSMLTRVRALLQIKFLRDERAALYERLWQILNQYVDETTARRILADLN